MTDSRSQANKNPFVPGKPSDTHTWGGVTNPAPSLRNSLNPTEFARLQKLAEEDTDAGHAAQSRISNALTETANIQSATTNDVIFELANDPDYKPNSLSALNNSTYRFKLYMTSEHELITGAGNATYKSVIETLDSLPKVTIAQSGVTAGFNIKD